MAAATVSFNFNCMFKFSRLKKVEKQVFWLNERDLIAIIGPKP
jgi:alkylated DNA repair dioxygenase AlkB